MNRKIVSLLLALCMIVSCVAVSGVTATAATKAVADTGASAELTSTEANNYGLASKVEDGNILHCFNWTLNDIKNELPNIAAAGFTSVQTSPLQPHNASGAWYWLYQPTDSTIGNELGDYNALKSLCEEAQKYGINDSIIHVDFMIGADDLSIDGIRADGSKSAIFRNGTWA